MPAGAGSVCRLVIWIVTVKRGVRQAVADLGAKGERPGRVGAVYKAKA